MSTDLRQEVEDWFREVWNNNNDQFIYDNVHEDCQAIELPGFPKGPEGFVMFKKTFCESITDLYFDLKRVVVEGDEVMGMCLINGTDIDSKTKVQFTLAFYAKYKDGKIIEIENYPDHYSYLAQTGDLCGQTLLKKWNISI